MRLLMLTILLFSVSCSPQKRLNRLVRKHPQLIRSLDTTVFVRDTVYQLSKFYYKGFKDSFELNKDSVLKTAKYRLSKLGEKYSLQVYPDTLFRIDTFFWEKILKIPGKIIDLTPGWIKWIHENQVPIAFAMLWTAFLTLVYRSRKSGGSKAIRG